MPRIKHITPSDPEIVDLARRFNILHEGKSLLNVLKRVWDDDVKAQRFLDTNRILFYGAKSLPSEVTSATPFIDYIHAVALAQRRLKWEGDEFLQLRRLIKKNYLKANHAEIVNTFLGIANDLREEDEAYERNFLNYAVEKLIAMSLEKKNEFENKNEPHCYDEESIVDIGDVDYEVRSGKHGFVVDQDMADKIADLFYAAAAMPWHVK